MEKHRPESYAPAYLNALTDDVLPFWERHSIDKDCGGYFSCLARDGTVYYTDKFIWLQSRQVWTFANFYNNMNKKNEWLAIAEHGARFLKKYGMDKSGNWYFALNRHGQALVQPYNIFSDCFAAMAFSQYALASGDDESLQIAKDTYANILRRKDDPKGRFSKLVPGTRPLLSLAIPMILANLVLEMQWFLDESDVEARLNDCVDLVMNTFMNSQTGLLHENAGADGSHPDCFDGKLINPGHGIEAMWFMMDIAIRRGDRELLDKAVNTVLCILDFSWDREHGGIYYFLDAGKNPPDKLEWDQKLWWVHLEALVALSMGYSYAGSISCSDWFEKVHRYTWDHFPDPDYGEWFGYLNRRGEVLLDLKGGKWKGCFHLPRALYRCHIALSSIKDRKPE